MVMVTTSRVMLGVAGWNSGLVSHRSWELFLSTDHQTQQLLSEMSSKGLSGGGNEILS